MTPAERMKAMWLELVILKEEIEEMEQQRKENSP